MGYLSKEGLMQLLTNIKNELDNIKEMPDEVIDRLDTIESRITTLEELMEQMDERIQTALDEYPLRTVCSYPIRGTGNIRVVAASSLDDK